MERRGLKLLSGGITLTFNIKIVMMKCDVIILSANAKSYP